MIQLTEDDDYIDWFIEQQPVLTKEESDKKMEELNRCADFIIKNGISPNLDSPY